MNDIRANGIVGIVQVGDDDKDFIHFSEWWNGEGYPLGLKGEDIPLECRILAIVDAFDAMTSDRPYRKALSTQQAAQELLRCAGVQFDPVLVNHFLEIINYTEK